MHAHRDPFLRVRASIRTPHHSAPHDSLASALRLRLPRRAATLASVTCLAIALLLTLVTQAAPLLGLAALACDPPCCHPTAAPALSADVDACAGVACTPEAVARAVGCVRVRGRLRWCALGFLLVAFVLKQLAAPKNAGKGRVGAGAGGEAGAARGQVAATRGRKGKGKRKYT